MRQSIRGWRSARSMPGNGPAAAQVQALAAPPGSAPMAVPFPYITQQPLRLGLGLVALVFYLWLIHSYKLPLGDVAVAGLAVGVLIRGGKLHVPGPLVMFLVFIIWNLLGFGVTQDTVITKNAITNLAKLWIIMFCIMNVVRTAAELRFLVIAWLGLYALYPVRGALYNQYICHCTEFGRVAWNFVFDNPNDLAALSLIPLGLAAGVATVERTKYFRLAALTGVMVLATLVMLTQSRGAILALGAAALLLPITSRRKGRDFLLLAMLFGVAAFFAPKDVWTRLAGLGNVSVEGNMVGVDKEGSAEARWQIWRVAGGTLRDHPLLGVGAGMMPTTHRWIALREDLFYTMRGERDTHSTYLRIGAETGYPGLALYLMIWGATFWRVRKARRHLRNARPGDHQFLFYMELAMVAYLVASIFGTYGALTFTYIGIAVAWLCAHILENEPWYVPPGTAAQLAAAPAARRGR